jgi:hypothetical protein
VSRCGWIAPPSSSQNEGTGASPGTGGALAAPVPQLIPGVIETLFQADRGDGPVRDRPGHRQHRALGGRGNGDVGCDGGCRGRGEARIHVRALGGFSNAAAIARRSGTTVEATNSHSDYFVKNLVSIREEQREALLVYRPSAFTVVSGLS